MKLGISTWSLTWACGVPGYPQPEKPLNPRDLIDMAEKWGLERVQLADNNSWDKLSLEELNQLACYAREKKVVLEAGMRGWKPEEIDRFLTLSSIIKSPFLRIVMVPSSPHAKLPTLREKEQALIAVIPRLLDLNMILCLENHDHFKVDELSELITGLNKKTGKECFGICLDTVNSLGALEDPQRVIHSLAPHTVNLHLKDFTINRVGHGMGFEITGTPLGEGRTDIKGILAALEPYERCQSAVIEQWVPPEKSMKKTIEKELKWLESGIKRAKPLFKK